MAQVQPSSSPIVFSVRRCEPELIVPAKPTTREIKCLSDIDDQEGLRFQVQFIMFYRSHPSMEGKDPVKIIRDALPKALVFYYPLAGRLVEGNKRKLMVDCNDEGILFIEADAEATIDQLGDTIQPPCPYIQELLHEVPSSADMLGCPLLLIQVTRFSCGGFAFAVRLNHALSDSLGLVKFLNTIAEVAGGSTAPSLLPVWERDIFNARNPPHVTFLHNEYNDDVTKNNTTKLGLDYQFENMVHCSFFFGPNDLRSIRRHLPPHLRQCSTFEVITACLWKCRTIALDLDPNDVVSLACANNLRGKKLRLRVPPGYYGNAFAFPAVLARVKTLCNNPLGYALDLVRKTKAEMGEEYIKSVADLMVTKGRPHYTATIWNYVVSDLSHVGLGDVDFGWGKAIYGGTAGALPYFTLYCRYRNSKGEDGIIVPTWLPVQAVEKFRQELLKFTQESTNHYPDVIEYPSIVSKL